MTRIRIPMGDQTGKKRHRQYTTKWMHRVTPDLIQHTRNGNGSTVGKVTLKDAAS